MKISIVIPCRNEMQYIGACLQSIVELNFDKSCLSVWVCDGMSTDGTNDVINQFVSVYDYIHYLENPRQTTSYALNIGVQNSKDADFIMILGAHSELSKDYLKGVFEIFDMFPDAYCVGGYTNNIYENDKAECIGKAMSSGFGVGNAHFRLGKIKGWVDTVAFGTYRREVFDRIGLFDETLTRNQDDEFSFRMQKNKMKIYLNSDCVINYHVRSSFRKLFKQYYQYGLWKVYVNCKHRAITTLRQTVPFCLVIYTLVSLIVSVLFPDWGFYSMALLLVYLVMALFFALRNGKNIKEAAGVFWSYLLLHYSYGLGYIVGTVKFAVLGMKPDKRDEKLTR